MDSFDHYATADLTEKWTATHSNGGGATQTIAAGSARTGAAGFRAVYSVASGCTSSLSKTLAPSGAGFVVGCAFRTDVAPNVTKGTGILGVWDTGVEQIVLVLLADLRLQVRRGSVEAGTAIATSTASVSLNVWAYVEMQGVIDPSTGSVAVRVNGSEVCSVTGVSTRATAVTQWTAVSIGIQAMVSNVVAVERACEYDDLYVLDGSGAGPLNAFLGDCRVDACLPTGTGATAAWTPSTGANWACVDEVPSNDDADYTSSATINQIDSFAVQDAPVSGTVYGVQAVLVARKGDAGAASVASLVRYSGVDYVGSDLNPGLTYACLRQIYPTNPGTSAAWTFAQFNASEFGYKRTA